MLPALGMALVRSVETTGTNTRIYEWIEDMSFSAREERKIRSLAEAEGMPESDGYEMSEGRLVGGVIRIEEGPGMSTCRTRSVIWEWTVEIGGRSYAVGQDPSGEVIAYADAAIHGHGGGSENAAEERAVPSSTGE